MKEKCGNFFFMTTFLTFFLWPALIALPYRNVIPVFMDPVAYATDSGSSGGVDGGKNVELGNAAASQAVMNTSVASQQSSGDRVYSIELKSEDAEGINYQSQIKEIFSEFDEASSADTDQRDFQKTTQDQLGRNVENAPDLPLREPSLNHGKPLDLESGN